MKREVDYTWRLAELMAAHGMHNSTDLIPRLAERGIQLSRPQVYRVVHQRPERVSLQLMAALCDILGCGVEDLDSHCDADISGGPGPRSMAYSTRFVNKIIINRVNRAPEAPAAEHQRRPVREPTFHFFISPALRFFSA